MPPTPQEDSTVTREQIRGEKALPIPEWVGPLAGFVVMFLIVGMGALYLWGSLLTTEDLVIPPPRINDEPETVRAVADVSIAETVSTSDSIEAITADIDSTLLNSLEQDLQAMDSEVESFMRSITAP